MQSYNRRRGWSGFGIAPYDPSLTPPDESEFHLCGSVTAPISQDNRFGVINSEIPAGRCAVLRHQGAHEVLTRLKGFTG
ncbi:GyrI-like domain-containing protein [Escherichia fergusonii]|uniref:GyrI-like domain-containing protein n=1 Tax=Escherichia fergusonii TaxID=564 RepID=UPI0030B945B9